MQSSAQAARGYLVDLDGTLMSGRNLLPGARDLLRALTGRFVIVSNDSEHTPTQLAARFARLGEPVPPDRFILAGTCAVDQLAGERPGARLMLLGSAALRAYASRRGLALADDAPDIVLVARDRHFTYRKLAAAAEAVLGGAELVVTCPDTTHPGPMGQPVPEAGALAAALLACTGPVPHRVVGKPGPTLFRLGCARLDIEAAEAVMIGDNPMTDGAGARAIGMAFWQALPGDLAPALKALAVA